MDNIRAMKTGVSDVVANSVRNAFGVMFRREVSPDGTGDGFAAGANQDICSSVSLWQDDALNVDFSFRFDRELLSTIAGEAYPRGSHDRKMLCEDIACAVANIVASNVKTYLNGRGYEMKMNIPAAGDGLTDEGQTAHLRFRCEGPGGDGILVNVRLQDRRGPKAG